ncbi:hypothetical protein [uncultured Shewanella sp.]|uniref:hypothetical protein n=1 Tax=uncultured Shewanella sp. TaxID=173975 RepID=UPI0026337B2E|nr:hypothetical protein [uncultured Shewanella sp.]
MKEQLYRLLPLTYREHDFSNQQSFRALMAVLEGVQDSLDENMMLLYQNWFIETCETGHIPYIADLVNLSELDPDPVFAIQRRYVANYLAYKRRSGIVPTLNNSVHDTSGYACYSINSTDKMLTSWSDRDPQLIAKTFNIKDHDNVPFSQAAHLPKFTSDKTGLFMAKAGELTPNMLQVYLWRKQPVVQSYAQLFPVKGTEHAWSLSPRQEVWPLCHQPQGLASLDTVHTAQQYPYLINPNQRDEVSSMEGRPSVAFFVYDGASHQMRAIEDNDVVMTDLSLWQSNDGQQARVLFDASLGRVLILDSQLNGKLLISYCYLHNAVVGASPRYRGVSQGSSITKRSLELYPSQDSLFEAFTSNNASQVQVSFANNAHYVLSQPLKIDLKGEDVTLVAEDYVCPTLSGQIEVTNTADTPARLILDGLRVYGQLHISKNVDIHLKDSSLLNDILWIAIPAEQNTDLRLAKIRVENGLIVSQKLMKHADYELNNSALICSSSSTVRAFCCHNSTLIGDITCLKVKAISNSLVEGTFTLINPNRAMLQYSYFSELVLPHGTQTEQVITDADLGRHGVQFSSTRYFDADFLVLAYGSAPQLLTGAANGEEVGVFNQLLTRKKEKNIKKQFDRFLPLGMEVQTYYMD